MKPQKKISIITLLSVSILAAGALATGCVAQTGGAEDPASSEQELNATGNTVAQPIDRAGAPAVQKNGSPIERITTKEGLTGDPPSNPGTAGQDDGDGTEPDPHPWDPHSTVPGSNGATKR